MELIENRLCENGKRFVRVGLGIGAEVHVYIRTDGVVEPYGGVRSGGPSQGNRLIAYGTFFDPRNPEADIPSDLLEYIRGI